MKLKTFARRAAAAGAVLAALTLAALPALAAPKVQVSTTNAVADHADILSDETEQYVNDVSIKLSDACGAQIGVYTLDELLGSTTMEGFAYDVFNAWGLGSDDLDNGVLLLLAPNEADGGDYYIMRGDGLESQLSFSTLGSLLDEYMEPYWVNGDYDTGIQKTVQALANRLCSIYGVTLNSSYTDTSAPDRGGPNVMGFVLLVVAVLLVIVGNYCLFTATSVVILKALRKNKAFYYKPRHFTAVSGMLYRMKQNAKGMHNICILATMLLVTISTTVCMYAGSEEALRRMYPDEIALSGHLDTGEEALTGDFAALEADYRRAVEQAGLSADNLTGRLQLSFAAGRKGDSFSLYVENDLGMSVYSLDFMVLEDYNRLTGRSATLAPDEVLCYNPGNVDLGDTLRIAGESWRVKETLTDYPVHGASFAATAGGSGQLFFVLADREALAAMDTLQRSAYGSNASNIDYEVTLNAGAGQAETRACLDALCQVWNEHFPAHGYRPSCRAEAADDYYGMNGSFLFLGIFLGLAFLIATVLMIYYKQISEGYEDRQRFVILQKVGMSRREVRATIRTQVLMVFFVPLLMAAVHMSFAFPMISRLLSLFSLNNVSLFLLCSLITFLVFALVYVAVYLVTARKYYQIVRL